MLTPTRIHLTVRVIICIVAAFSIAESARAQSRYTIINLGTLGSNYSAGHAINNAGQVVGQSHLASGDSRAFLYTDGAMLNLGVFSSPGSAYSIAWEINDRGQVIGFTDGGPGLGYHAFLYTDGSMLDVGTLSGSGFSSALGINEAGHVVGWSTIGGTGLVRPFLYKDGQMVELPTLAPHYPNVQGVAVAINNAGQIAGKSNVFSGWQHAFIYHNGRMIDLGTLGGNNSEATDMNSMGHVVGYSNIANGAQHAFLYKDGSMLDLGTLGGPTSIAMGLNDSGQVVGVSDTADGGRRPFIYDAENGMRDLNTLLPPGSGWHLEFVWKGINNSGQVTGYGYYNGEIRAFLLSPPPSDSVAPVSSVLIVPQPNSTGWLNSDATVTLDAADNDGGSGVQEIKYSIDAQPYQTVVGPIDISAEGETVISFYATDEAGNSEAPQAVTIKIDKSEPLITASATAGGSPYTPGTWINQNVLVEFSCADVGPSGVGSVTDLIIVISEGANQSAVGICTDNAGNSSSGTFFGINVDKTAPVLSIPHDLSVDAASPSGALVTYSASAIDNLDASPSVSCSPPSGSTFPVGDTTVVCSVLDDAGNGSTRSFNVHVKGASEQINDLVSTVNGFNIHGGTANSLNAKLQTAWQAIAAGDLTGACSGIDDFINHARAQSGKKLTASQATELIAEATRIKMALGCV